MRAREQKENVIYKIVLDVLGAYLIEYDCPSFEVDHSLCLASPFNTFTIEIQEVHSLGN